MEQPSRGRVAIDGQAVAGAGRSVPPEARGVGLMFQDYALFPHLTVAQNVRFGLAGRTRAEGDPALDLLAQVGLAALAESYPPTLSGGEQQRVALVRALAPRPRLLLLDEPFSNLDRRMRDTGAGGHRALLRRTGTTALLVTHDPEEALAVASRVALMRGGRIVQVASGESLYRRPASLFAARFLADAAEIPGPCRDGAVATPLGPVPAPGFPEGARLRVCLRPEAVVPGHPGTGRPPGAAPDLPRRRDPAPPRGAGPRGPVRARLAGHGPYGAGDAAGVTLDPDAVLVLPDED